MLFKLIKYVVDIINLAIYNRIFLMPTTRKQKKARKSRVKMLSDIENLDVILGGNHLERDESETSNYCKSPESPSYGTLLNQDSNSHPNSHEAEIRTCAQYGQNSREIDSGSEFNRLSGELNQRITREMSDFMSTVSSQIQRAINEAISDQILPQIQATLKSGQGHEAERGWENPARRLEYRSEEALDRSFRSDSRDECHRFANRYEDLESTHDRCIDYK